MNLNLGEKGRKMKFSSVLAWLAIFLGTAMASSIANASDGQPLALNIQMVPASEGSVPGFMMFGLTEEGMEGRICCYGP
jgi:hypothetical protein